MKSEFLRRSVVTIMVVLAAVVVLAAQEDMKASLPVVISAATPLYPIGPHTANIQGSVRLQVKTDGHRVVEAEVKDDGGNPALGRAARENALTWQFSNHNPLSFEVSYRYVLVDKLDDIQSNAPNSKVVIRFPTSVEVYARRWPGSIDVPMEMKRDRQHTGATMSLCSLQKQAAEGSRQMAVVSGVYGAGLENATLEDAGCPEETTWVELESVPHICPLLADVGTPHFALAGYHPTCSSRIG